MRGEW